MLAALQIYQTFDCFQLLATNHDHDLTSDAISIAGHQFYLLCNDLHVVCCKSLVKGLHHAD